MNRLLRVIVVLSSIGVALGSARSARADLSFHFEGSGVHEVGTLDTVVVHFSIVGPNDLRDLVEGVMHASSYNALYASNSSDSGFNVADMFTGMGTVMLVDDMGDERVVQFNFPQNPLPGGSGEGTTAEFTVLNMDGQIAAFLWEPSPYNFSDGVPTAGGGTIPEPASISLLSLAGAVVLSGRRRRRR